MFVNFLTSQNSNCINMGTKGNPIDLSLNTVVTTSSEGYVHIAGGSVAGTAVVVDFIDKNGIYMFNIFEVTPATNAGSCTAIFVKKGTKLKCTRKDNGTTANFYPITY